MTIDEKFDFKKAKRIRELEGVSRGVLAYDLTIRVRKRSGRFSRKKWTDAESIIEAYESCQPLVNLGRGTFYSEIEKEYFSWLKEKGYSHHNI